MRALLFPGQGAQNASEQALHDIPEVANLLQIAQPHIAADLLRAGTGPSNQDAVQTYLYVVGVASAALLQHRGVSLDAVAGLSIGTFSAAVACGAATFESLLPVVIQRGRLMQAAFPTGSGLGLVEGLSESAIDKLIRHLPGTHLSIAIVHPGRRIVVAGPWATIETLFQTARTAGATRAHRLDVPCPSHSPQMAPVAEALQQALGSTPLAPPHCPYFSNSKNRLVRDPEAIRGDLAWNVARQVRWSDGLDLLREIGIHTFVEALPGDSLCRLADTTNTNETWSSLP